MNYASVKALFVRDDVDDPSRSSMFTAPRRRTIFTSSWGGSLPLSASAASAGVSHLASISTSACSPDPEVGRHRSGTGNDQTLEGSFSAVWTATIATK